MKKFYSFFILSLIAIYVQAGPPSKKLVAACDLKLAFAVPSSNALSTKNASYTKVYVYGSNAQLQASNISNFTINWSLEYRGLWQFSINTQNGVPSYWVDLLPKIRQTFSNSNPEMTLSNTGVVGLDGNYYVAYYGNNFALVEKTGLYAILFSNASSAPVVCTSSFSVTGVTLDKASLSIRKSSTVSLIATVLPTNATNKSLTWSSDNTTIATVDNNGVVFGMSKGTANITVKTADGGFTAKSLITVTDDVVVIPVTGVTVDKASVKIEKGQTATIMPSVLPSNATNKSLTWSASNSSIATVSNGVVIAISKGTTTITVTTTDGGFVAQSSVEVTETISTCTLLNAFKVPATTPLPTQNKSYSKIYVYGNPTNLNLSNVNNFTINWSLEYKGLWQFSLGTTDNKPAYYVDLLPTVQQNFASANPAVTITNSGITGFDGQYYTSFYGTDFVLVEKSGAYAILFSTLSSAPVVCSNQTIVVTGVIVSPPSVSLDVSQQTQLTASVLPSNASNKNVTWSSTNTNIASVSASGLVTAKAVGSVVISVTTVDGGFSAISNVTINVATANAREGMATHFEAFGKPYGGCGVPEDLLGTQNYVALNVFNTPGIYDSFVRPLAGADTAKMGEFANGCNCGRWIEVTMSDNCNGINDGHPNEPFCRQGTGWYSDKYNNSKLYFLVADACGDGNAWCRDSRYHLDLSTHVLNDFKNADGSSVNDMYPLNFNNRKVKWQYVDAPNYTGDIKIYFMQDAKMVWPAIVITNLKNGIHGVEQKVGSQWVKLKMNSDLGQSFILSDLNQPYTIRVYDATGKLINNGRQYTFNFPGACGQACATTTQTNYTTFNPFGRMANVEDDNFEITIFPNPTKGSITIEAGQSDTFPVTVSVVDMEGRVRICQLFESGSRKLNVKDFLKEGVYIIKIQNRQRIFFKKLVVE